MARARNQAIGSLRVCGDYGSHEATSGRGFRSGALRIAHGFKSLGTFGLTAMMLCASSETQAQNRMALSPDGLRVVYTSKDMLVLRSTSEADTTVRIDAASDVTVPTWSPDGRLLAYYHKENQELQLWVYDVSTGERRPITSVKGGISPNVWAYYMGWISDPLRFSWSPDSKSIVFSNGVSVVKSKKPDFLPFPTKEEQEKGAPVILTRGTPPSWTLHGVVSYGSPDSYNYGQTDRGRALPTFPQPKATQLFIVDIGSGVIRQITHDDNGYFTPVWSPDGKSVAFMSPEKLDLSRFDVETNIFIQDLATGRVRKITSGPTQKLLPAWSPDGRELAYYWRDVRGTFFRKGEGINIVSVSAEASAVPLAIAPGLDRWISGFGWSADSTGLVLAYRDGLAWPLIFADRRGGRIVPISKNGSVAMDFSAGSGGVTWFEIDDPNGKLILSKLPPNDFGNPTVLSTTARSIGKRHLERVSWTNGQGDSLEGMLIYPLNYSAGKRYPLVVDTYSYGLIDLEGFEDLSYVRASEQYFLFRPNHRAPHMWLNPLKGAAYDAAAVGSRGAEVLADDIMTGVESLARRGLIDINRMCVYGFSNGGLEGELLLTQTDKFKCAAFLSPASSNVVTGSLLNTDDREYRHWINGMDPWNGLQNLVAASPVFQAERISTPILLAAGDQEELVIPTAEMYNALRFLKKDVTFLRYRNSGHGLVGKEDEDFMNRLKGFFHQYLDLQPAPRR